MRMISALRDDIRRVKQYRFASKNECFDVFFVLINSYVQIRLIIIVRSLWRCICVIVFTQLIVKNLS